MKLLIKLSFIALLFLNHPIPLSAHTPDNDNNGPSKSRITFSENKGQWEKRVLFRAQLDGGLLFLEKNCLTYAFYDKETLRKSHAFRGNTDSSGFTPFIRKHAFRVNFKGCNPDAEIKPFMPSDDYENYFIGKDPRKWAGHVRKFQKIFYEDLYNGIDAEFIGKENSLKYNFIVKPGGEVKDIQLEYQGVNNLFLKDGALRITTSLNEIVEQKPYAYQLIKGRKKEIPCTFRLDGKVVSFALSGTYNTDVPLIIDPVLIFASYSGSLADNFGMTATYDAYGNFYSGGTAFAQGYPTTVGAYDTSYNGIIEYGRTDVVITKYNSTGSDRYYATYIGGATGSEIVTSLIVNAQDELFLYGATGSSDFPVTKNAYDTLFHGGDTLRFIFNGTYFDKGTDIYVAKLSADGSNLLGASYLGGSLNDGVNHNNKTTTFSYTNNGNTYFATEYLPDSLQYNYGDQYRGEIVLDKSGNCYIASSSRSPDFPIKNGFDNTLGGRQDAVVVKLNSTLTDIVFSTYLGGSDNDCGNALEVDDSSNVYVTGGTRSSNFPTTAGTLYPTYRGGKADGYITIIKNDGSGILYSSLIGTNQYDQSYFIQLDRFRNVYLYGQTLGNFPKTPGVYSNPLSGQFIIKLTNNLSSIIYSTTFGRPFSGINISPAAFLIDYCENIYISGWGGDIIYGPPTYNMPITADAQQDESKNPDGFNFYLMTLSKDATTLLYGSYFGGPQSQEHVDGGTSRFDKKGVVYQSVCAGCGGHDDFPTTPGSYSQVNKSQVPERNCNNGIFKFDFGIKLASANFISSQDGCLGEEIKFQNTSSTTKKVFWDFGNNDTTSEVSPVRKFTTPGKYMIKLIVTDPTTCNVSDTNFRYITIHEKPKASFSYTITPCKPEITLNSTSTHPNPLNYYKWDFGNGTNASDSATKVIYPEPDTVNISLKISDIYGCSDSVLKSIIIPQPLKAMVNTTPVTCKDSCNGKASLVSSGGITPYSIKWKNGKTTITVDQLCAGKDSVTVVDQAGCAYKTDYTIISPLPLKVDVQPEDAYCSGKCFGKATALVSGGTVPYSYKWNDPKKQTTASAVSLCPGSYLVMVEDSNKCPATASTTITSSDHKPEVKATADDTLIFRGLKTTLHATRKKGYQYKWEPPGTLNNPASSDPVASPLAKTTYIVEVTDSNSCTNTDSVTIYLKDAQCAEPEIFIPNGFTPNDDGNNDILYVRGLAIQEMYLAIYNRWGEKIFESTNPQVGWDGYYKGEKVTPAVYAYYLKVKCVNHQEFFKKGNITLIR